MSDLFEPVIFLMNRISYKIKITTLLVVSILLFLYPTYVAFNTIILEKKSYQSELKGILYYEKFYTIVESISKYKQFSDKEKIEKLFADLSRYDSQNFNIIGKELRVLKDNLNYLEKFENRYNLENKLITLFESISSKIYFSRSSDPSVYQTESILYRQMKLIPLLQELKFLGDRVFSKAYLLPNEKVAFTKISMELELILQKNLISKKDLLFLSFLERQKRQMNNFSNLIEILNKNIIDRYNARYSQSLFNKKIENILNSSLKSHKELFNLCSTRVIKLLEYTEYKERSFIFTFLSILLVLSYLYISFYKSIIIRLTQLQKASWKISKGDFQNIEIFKNAKDEIGDLFLAFNQMKSNIIKNIAFLDSYKMSIDQSSIVSKTNQKGIITYVNQKFCDISGYSQEELIGKPHNIIRHPDVPKEAFKDLWQTIQSGKIWHGIVKNRKKDGDYYIVDATVSPITDENGEVHEYIAVRHDVTELEKSKEQIRKQKEEEIRLQETDLLTGLPNRIKMIKDLKSYKNSVLVFLNISSFGQLNEFYGTDVGDKVLIKLSSILEKIVEKKNVHIYKMHSAEFAFVLDKDHYTKDDVEKFILKTIEKVESEKIYCKEDNCITLSLIAGISYNPKTLEEIFAQADIALKKAKKSNKSILFYDENMKKKSNYENNMLWIDKIKKAISEDKIVPYFQPIIDNKTEVITKYESLVRLIDDEGKVISPFFFLDIARRAKLYSQITRIVINKSFEVFESLPHYEFSINLSMEDILNSDTVEFIIAKLNSYTHTNRVIFEILESEEISDYDLLTSFIKKIKSYGAKIAIDDFGTGYSNFEHILTLDADFIKIDGSLIKNIDTDENASIITSAIIAFSRELNKKTVVEFVHNKEVYEKVKRMGADYSQGYYLGEPKEKPLSLGIIDKLSNEIEFMI